MSKFVSTFNKGFNMAFAEIMIRDTNADGGDVILGNGDVVAGWLDTGKVAALIHACSTARNTPHLNQMLNRMSL